MTDKDDMAAAFYEDEENRALTAARKRRQPRSTRLTTHVPIRFSTEVIESVKRFAEEDGMTISSWIRAVVEREVRWRLARLSATTSSQSIRFEMIKGPQVSTHTGYTLESAHA